VYLAEEKIKKYYESHDVEIVSMKQISTIRIKENKFKPWILKLKPSIDFRKVRAISTVDNHCIVYESLMRKNDILQCHNCKRFNHGSSGVLTQDPTNAWIKTNLNVIKSNGVGSNNALLQNNISYA